MEITFRNILQYFEGNTKQILDKFNLLSPHLKEQVSWRLNICKLDCVQNGKCVYCSCSLPGKAFTVKSCNKGERFPDLMSAEDWDKYKTTHKLNIDDAQQGI